ncbi:MAG: DUF362 domain-containing protein [Clostridia bacterium]|nr:DUF362 domain-containing protein [Clostridia bacterium]
MKNIKAAMVYTAIVILFVATTAGCFVSNNSEKAGTDVRGTASANEATAKKISEDTAKKNTDIIPEATVGVGRGTDYAKVTRQAIENAGGLKKIVKKGATVIIKPNLISYAPPESGIVTDYRVVQEIVNMVKECGAGKIIIAEASPSGNMFELHEYNKIAGVELLDMSGFDNEKDCYQLTAKNSLTGKAIPIPKVYMDADVVITAAKLKTHSYPDAVVSLGLKNSIGVPPGKGTKMYLHNMGLKEVIVDLNKIRKPDFVVIDGIIGLEGPGPTQGDPVKSNIIFAGTDVVATDTAALTFMGYTASEIPHIKLAGENGLGVSDINKIKTIGADLNAIKMKFKGSQN